MANQLYSNARQLFLTGQLNWNTANIMVALVSADYVFDPAHQHLDDIPAEAIFAETPLPGEFSVDGFASGGVAIFYALETPSPVTQIVLYASTGDASTSPLLAMFDSASGLPFTGNGGAYAVSPDQSFGGFFRL